MGSGQSGLGCRNASARPSTSVRPSRCAIQGCGANCSALRDSVSRGGRGAPHGGGGWSRIVGNGDVGMRAEGKRLACDVCPSTRDPWERHWPGEGLSEGSQQR